MYWDSFFRELNSEKQHKKEGSYLCTCRESGKGALVHEPGRRLRFIGQCSPDKACFKIRFDSKRVLSRKLQIVPKTRRIRRKEVREPRITLDFFLGLSQTSRDTNSDIPRPPPPHSVANPKDS